jgi:hypothetical protein
MSLLLWTLGAWLILGAAVRFSQAVNPPGAFSPGSFVWAGLIRVGFAMWVLWHLAKVSP